MSQLSVHPVAELPEADRLEYIRLVASIALCDGFTDPHEIGKLHRLADALHLHEAVTAPLFQSLEQDRLDAPVLSREAVWFKNPLPVRWHLMIDSIAVAFSDGRLSPGETQRLAELARQLEIPPEDVMKMADRIESILFKQDADHAHLARELGAAVGGDHHGEHLVGRVRKLSGSDPTSQG